MARDSSRGFITLMGILAIAGTHASTRSEEAVILRGHSEAITALAFLPDGKTLVSGSEDCVKLWDVANSRERVTIEAKSREQRHIAISADGQTLATSWATNEERGAKLWKVETGKLVATFSWKSDPTGLTQVLFAPDGRRLVILEHTALRDRRTIARLWDIATAKELAPFEMPGDKLHAFTLNTAVFSPDGKVLALGGMSMRIPPPPLASPTGELRLWDTATMKEGVQLEGNLHRIYSVAFSPDGKTIVAGSGGGGHLLRPHGEVTVWDAATGKQQTILKGEGRRDIVQAVVFSPDGKTLAAASTRWSEARAKGERPKVTEAIQLWDVATWRLQRVFVGHGRSVRSMAFTPDGQTLVSTDMSDVRLWDAATGKERALVKDANHETDTFAISPDGKKLATACQEFSYKDGTVQLWDMAKLLQQKAKP
jgi:WD40 repeat protein